MKLELKHLANYLPYKLKIYTPFGFRPNGKESTGVSRVVYLTGDLYADIENNTFQGETFKPIFRPLSDLTKPCLEGGKVPLMELCKMAYDNHKNFRQRGNVIEILSGEYALYNFYWQKNGFVTIHISDKMGRIIPNQIDLFSYLFKNHFDIYNLIQNGLAIDINTIKEEK